MSEPSTRQMPSRRTAARAAFWRRGPVRGGAALAVAAAAAFIVWLTISGSGQKGLANGQGTPVPVSLTGLHTLATALPAPIYWVGPMHSVTYELTNSPNGRVFIRYLPAGVAIGADKPYLTIATYPLTGAYQATKRAASQAGAVRVAVKGGAVAFYNKSRPVSVYFTEQGSDYQVEVYDPSAARARSLVASGEVHVVVTKSNPAAPNGAVAVSPAGLRTLAATLHHPLYWLGEGPGRRYEVTQTTGGKVFIRYLPQGVEIGANKPYLTVATYPFPNALAAVKREAKKGGASTIKLAGGGLALVDAQYPESVHLAFPGSNYQVEVFDPSPTRARKVVMSGQVQPVK